MNINNIQQSYVTKQSQASLVKNGTEEIIQSSKLSGKDQVEISQKAQETLGVTKKIMSEFDLNNISNNEILDMAKQLHENNLINGFEYANMTAVTLPINLPQYEGIDPDQRRNFISEYEASIVGSRAMGLEKKSLDFMEQLLSNFKYFDNQKHS